MSIPRFGDHNCADLIQPAKTGNGSPQILPRLSRYGSSLASKFGLIPIGEMPDIVPDWADVQEVIEECEQEKIFPVFHSREKGIFKDGYDQNGLGYCWAWSAAGTLMTCRGVENQETVQLAPTSLGWLVNWKNTGYYLDATINGMKDKGVASVEYVPDIHSINPNSFRSGWEEDALRYRVLSWWDTDRSLNDKDFICQCLGILRTGRPLYIAYNWWGHAVQVHGLRWDTSELNNIVWLIQNSHGDNEVIELTGARGVPDEAYGVRATT